MSIWEVRNNKQHFTYSQIMLWVAFDRGLRLAEKRCFPCPNRAAWLKARDELCEEIMEKGELLDLHLHSSLADSGSGYNNEMQCFIQSYENNTMLDSSILIAPLVFFISPCDPRFLNTLDRILLPPEKGGLTSTGLVYRYDTELSEDGERTPLGTACLSGSGDHELKLTIPRGWRSRRRLQHVHILARRSHDPRKRLRAQVPHPGDQSVREHAELLEPSVHVFRGNREKRRAAGEHAAGVQPPGPD